MPHSWLLLAATSCSVWKKETTAEPRLSYFVHRSAIHLVNLHRSLSRSLLLCCYRVHLLPLRSHRQIIQISPLNLCIEADLFCRTADHTTKLAGRNWDEAIGERWSPTSQLPGGDGYRRKRSESDMAGRAANEMPGWEERSCFGNAAWKPCTLRAGSAMLRCYHST